MSITTNETKQVLLDKGVKYLYHANTVATSLTFFSQGGLLSRGAVEERGLFQTFQGSDSLDKRLGVFNDIYFDSVDIHARAKDLNKYGPVTFVYSIDILDRLAGYEVKVTRDNPIRWKKTMPESERYFTNLALMLEEYKKGTFQQHLTICDIHEPLPFSPCLVKVLIDNPHIANTQYFDHAYQTIQECMEKNRLNIPLEVRRCADNCKCRESYGKCKNKELDDKFGIHN